MGCGLGGTVYSIENEFAPTSCVRAHTQRYVNRVGHPYSVGHPWVAHPKDHFARRRYLMGSRRRERVYNENTSHAKSGRHWIGVVVT